MLLKLGEAVLAIDRGYDGVELVDAIEPLLGHQGVHDGGGVCEPGGLQDRPAHGRDFAPQRLGVQLFQGVGEVPPNGAAYTARRQQDCCLVDFLDQGVVDANLAELVYEHSGALHSGVLQQAFEQRCFARAEKASQEGEGDGRAHGSTLRQR